VGTGRPPLAIISHGHPIESAPRQIRTRRQRRPPLADPAQTVNAEETKHTIVGVAATAVFIAVIILMQFRAELFAKTDDEHYFLTATFGRVDGIAPDSPVRLGGIPIGKVTQLRLTGDYRVRMTMEIDKGFLLPTDSSASIQTDGLFGPKSVRIDPGGSLENLKNGGHIEYSQDPLNVSDLLDLIIAEGRAARAPSPTPADSKPADSKTEGP
jgi:phospholipid/cholesterol/gamma-HCH transport system substrate-binding protein